MAPDFKVLFSHSRSLPWHDKDKRKGKRIEILDSGFKHAGMTIKSLGALRVVTLA